MKRILVLLLGIVLFSCNTKTSSNSNTSTVKTELNDNSENFDWLLGKWKRNNEKPGKETFEQWKKHSRSEYSGIGYTLQDGDTVSMEKISLIKVNEKWALVVKVGDGSDAVTFNMNHFTKDEFSCINKTHDFPKKIKYWKKGEKLNALVAGDDMEIQFEFEKLSKKPAVSKF